VVAILAVLKAGGAYLPVDPAYPAERVALMVADSGAVLVIGDAVSAGQVAELSVPMIHLDDPGLAAALVGADPGPVTDADRRGRVAVANAAYVIYTSGSTGTPKGVAVSHAGLASMVAAQVERLAVTPASRVLQFASPAFDASVWEWCMALLTGARLVLVGPDELAAGEPLVETIAVQGVTHATLPPAVLKVVPAGSLPSVESLVVAGEAISPELVAGWSAGRRMINAYGPTETTVCATMSPALVGDGQTPPIGRPIANTQVYVLDAALRLVAPGVAGELYIAGVGLARGYLGQPALTADRFVACSYGGPGARMFRTGDVVRWNGDGQLEYIGRTDFQVKVRGFRIELGEIEHVLAQHPGVVQAAVVAREDQKGDKRLVAYVVPDPDAALAELPEYLRGRLPDYMVPAVVVPLSELPLTAAGKLDRRALPAEDATAVGGGAPRNAHEEKLCSFFCELLGLEKVGIDDSFFELGGHSLLATRLIASIRKQFGIDMPVRTIILYPTVAELAALMLAGGIPDKDIDPFAVVLPLNRGAASGKPPVWFFHGGGGLGWPYFSFAPYLDRPSYALQSRGFNGTDPLAGSVEEMIDDYLTQIIKIQPEGPYHLIGWSMGGPVAHAVAEALDRRGHAVPLLAILDCQPAISGSESGYKLVASITPEVYREEVEADIGQVMSTEGMDDFLENMAKVGANNTRAMGTFESPVYRGNVLYFNAKDSEWGSYAHYWRQHVLGSIEEYDVDATHHDLHMPKPAGQVMKVIVRKLAEE
jgi:amino acid adenylation domain-containing protein